MVRLKGANLALYSLMVVLFQFHMVRLKARGFSFLTSFVLFQFHMVRLKDTFHILILLRVEHISIPHGTIKSLAGHAVEAADLEFQFHMVRLKVRHPDRGHRLLEISIPHGTIKSMVFGIS